MSVNLTPQKSAVSRASGRKTDTFPSKELLRTMENSLHPIFANIVHSHARVTEAVTPAPGSPPPNTYRGWEITWDYGHYTATSPDYDASWEGCEDGWVDNGLRTSARMLPDLYAEVDAILDGDG